jgi:hypothetical protein
VLPTLFFALALSASGPSAPRPVTPLAVQPQTILLCAQTDAHGKVVEARLVQSSGSEELDQSAKATVMGSDLVPEASAKAGAWFPIAIAVGGEAGDIAAPNCNALAALTR